MDSKKILQNIANLLIRSENRYQAHSKMKSQFERLCKDKTFIFDALKDCISKSSFWENPDNLVFPLYLSGDIIISINLFVPIRDKSKNITQDNIHHHGWRLLTTGVISGKGYETITFEKNSHLNKKNNHICLTIKDDYTHVSGPSKFIDSRTPHVVFHPKETCATLACWSADKPMINQSIKRYLTSFPKLRKILVRFLHKTKISKFLGLNPIEGLYFHPEGGKIIETQNYSKPFDGDTKEIIHCYFKFFEQIGFNKENYFLSCKQYFDETSLSLYNDLIAGKKITDLGIWGNPLRRFSKKQILMTLKNNQ